MADAAEFAEVGVQGGESRPKRPFGDGWCGLVQYLSVIMFLFIGFALGVVEVFRLLKKGAL